MTISELIEKITNSVLSEEAKQAIIDVANTYQELTPELETRVKEMIQEDIDKDLAALDAENQANEAENA